MAQYKVLQDIEAEDKLLGPLSLRQFIYAAIVVVLGFVGFKLAMWHWFLAIPFLPPIAFFGLLAAPFGRDQPSEVWLLAKIKFYFKARRRVWDQAGVKELVTITVPKKIERVVSKGFSDTEVRSRLKALADTLDTRGWAVKNVDTSVFQQQVVVPGSQSDDRLLAIPTAQAVPDIVPDPEDDVLNEDTATAQHVEHGLEASTQMHRQALLQKVRKIADDQKQVQQTARPVAAPTARTAPVRQPIISQPKPVTQPVPIAPQVKTQPAPQTAVTPPSDPAILKLVKNNDLNISTVEREANRKKGDQSPDDEVVISLR